MFSWLSGPKPDANMIAAIDSRDAHTVVNYIADHRVQILKDPNYIPLLLRVLREYKTNLDANMRVLELLLAVTSGKASGLSNKFGMIYKEGGIRQIVENMEHFYTELELISLSFSILEGAVQNNKACVGPLSEVSPISIIAFAMSTHKNQYQKVCSKGINIFLKLLESEEFNAKASSAFASANVFDVLYYLIQSASSHGKDASSAIEVLSLLNLPGDTMKFYEGLIKSVLDEIFIVLNRTVLGGDRPQGPALPPPLPASPQQAVVNRQTFLYSLRFVAKAVFQCLPIQKYLIDKDYLSVVAALAPSYAQDTDVLLSLSQVITNFTISNQFVKATITRVFFALIPGVVLSDVGAAVHTAFLGALYSLENEDKEVSTQVIGLGLVQRTLEIMRKNTSNVELQKNGIKAISTAIMWVPENANEIFHSDFNFIFAAMKKLAKSATLRVYNIYLINGLNKVPLNKQNVVVMMNIVSLGNTYFEKEDKSFQERYKDFEKIDDEMITEMEHKGPVKIFVESLRVFSKNSSIMRSCLFILESLSRARKSLLGEFEACKGIKTILDTMKFYPQNSDILSLACRIFVNLAANSDCVVTYHRLAGSAEVIRAMKNNQTAEHVQEWGAYVIVKYMALPICKYDLEREVATIAINNAHKVFPDNLEIQKFICAYFSMLTAGSNSNNNSNNSNSNGSIGDESSKRRDLVRRLEAHRTVLKLFKERKSDAIRVNGFHGFCNLVLTFNATEIPNERSLGIATILGFMADNKQDGDIICKGLVTILKTLRFKPSVQNEINKGHFVHFVLDVTIAHIKDDVVVKATNRIFSAMKFVQGRDTVDLAIVEYIIRNIQTRVLYEESLILLSKLAALRDIAESPQMEQAINVISKNVQENNYDITLQKYSFRSLGAMGDTEYDKINITIAKTGVIWMINALNFKYPENIDAIFILLHTMEVFNQAMKTDICNRYCKPILEAVRRPDLQGSTRLMGYNIISDLSLCSSMKRGMIDKDIFFALEFLIRNLENDTVFNRTSSILNLASVNCNGAGRIAEAAKTMLLNREDPKVQIKECQEVTEEEFSERSRTEALESGIMEALLIAMLTHRNNATVQSGACKAITHIGKAKVHDFGERFADLRIEGVLISLLTVHKDSENLICEMCEALATIECWIEINPNVIKKKIRPEYLHNPKIVQHITNIKVYKSHGYNEVYIFKK